MADRHISYGSRLYKCATGILVMASNDAPLCTRTVAVNNWERHIAGVKRVDRMRMGDLREGMCRQKCPIGRLFLESNEVGGAYEKNESSILIP